jgi:uncharacterized protein with ATP-grasp and redox domains
MNNKMHKDCIQCHRRNIVKLVEKHKKSDPEKNEILKHLNQTIDNNLQCSNVFLSTIVHRQASQLLHSDDFYQQEKDWANRLLLAKYDKWQQVVKQSKSPLQAALKLAIIGNIIDYGAHSVPEDIEQYINDKFKASLTLDHSRQLFEAIPKAKSILYLADNAGEIIFDKLLIETINHPNVTVAVRGKAIINDVTLREAQSIGLPNISKVISNGFDAPSTLLNYCSEEFKIAFQSADLIISKGQGNYEGLIEMDDPRLYFLLTAKCDYIAKLLKVKKGDLVAGNAQLINNKQCHSK